MTNPAVMTQFEPEDENQIDLPLGLPEVEQTTGKNGWAGELSKPGVPMKGGNISNVPYPYMVFDFECLIYCPELFAKKVGWLEKFPLSYFNDQSKQYYKRVPRSVERLTELVRYAYNVGVAYVGPKHLWKHREELLEPFPYTTLFTASNPSEFVEQITLNDAVMTYYTLSEIRRQHAGPKAVLFQDWNSLGMEKR